MIFLIFYCFNQECARDKVIKYSRCSMRTVENAKLDLCFNKRDLMRCYTIQILLHSNIYWIYLTLAGQRASVFHIHLLKEDVTLCQPDCNITICNVNTPTPVSFWHHIPVQYVTRHSGDTCFMTICDSYRSWFLWFFGWLVFLLTPLSEEICVCGSVFPWYIWTGRLIISKMQRVG